MIFTMRLYVSFGSLNSWSCFLAASPLSSVEHILPRILTKTYKQIFFFFFNMSMPRDFGRFLFSHGLVLREDFTG